MANNEARDIHDEEKINNVSEGCGESTRFPATRNVGWRQLTEKLFYRHYSQLESNDLPKNMPPSFGQLISLGWLMQGKKKKPAPCLIWSALSSFHGALCGVVSGLCHKVTSFQLLLLATPVSLPPFEFWQ